MSGAEACEILVSGKRRCPVAAVLAACLVAALCGPTFGREKDEAAAVTRIRRAVEFLSDDDMQGRGLGTKGLDRAAGFIGQEFMRMGLATDLCDGTPFQTFTVRVTNKNRREQIDWMSALARAGIRHAGSNGAKVADSGGHSGTSTLPQGSSTRKPLTPDGSKPRTAKIKNVVAALEGAGPRAEETIVIGAHYDHLGERCDDDGEPIVYNGANDNASGTAALLEVARILSSRKEKLPRRIVFVAFSGEEQGLLGSLHYVAHPAVPMKKTIAMINLDMVGRLEDDQIMAMGTGSSPALAKMAQRISKKHGLRLLPIPFSWPCSDHAPFYSHMVPVVFFATTGGFRDYHGPGDDAETLDYAGIRRVALITADLAVEVAKADEPPQYVKEGLPGTLLRGVVRIFGQTAKEIVTEKPEKTKKLEKAERPAEPEDHDKPAKSAR